MVTLADVQQWESEIPKENNQNKFIPTLKDVNEWDKEAANNTASNKTRSNISNYRIPGMPSREAFNQLMNFEISQPAGNFLAMTAPRRMLSAAGKAAEMIPVLNKLFGGVKKAADTNKLLSGVGQVGRTAAEGAIGGAITTPENRLGGAEAGGSLGAVFGTANKLLGAGANAINPFKTSLSPEELQANLIAARNTQTPLGDVIQSPMLQKGYENYLQPIPGSGIEENLQNLGKNIKDRGEAFVQKLRGSHEPIDIPSTIVDSLKKVGKESKKLKNTLYGKLDKVAEEANFKPQVTNFMKEAKRSKEALDSIEVLKHDPDLKSLYQKISRYEEPLKPTTEKSVIVSKEGKPFTKEVPAHQPSLKEATLLKSKLSSYADTLKKSPDAKSRLEGGTLGRLASSLDRDIKISMKNAPENVQDMYKKTNENFKKNFLPNLEPEIYKFSQGKGDADTLVQSLIKPNRNNLSDKLLSRLSDKDKHLIGYSFLQKAIDQETGSVNPQKLKNLYMKLSPHQKEMIFGKNMKKSLDNYSKLVGMNTEALTGMSNPKTGARLMGFAGLGAPAALGGALGGIPGAGIGFVGGGIGANVLGKSLTSPTIRKHVVNALSKPGGYDIQNKLQRAIGAGSTLAAPHVRNVFSGSEE